jgi:hypothetical protein
VVFATPSHILIVQLVLVLLLETNFDGNRFKVFFGPFGQIGALKNINQIVGANIVAIVFIVEDAVN